MKKKGWLLLIIALIIVPIQLSSLQYAFKSSSQHDLEFTYKWDWDVKGGSGAYYGYTEKYDAIGHYSVDFIGNVGQVRATVEWEYTEDDGYYYPTTESGTELYTFTYDIGTGAYLSETDQDELNTAGMNVWFHVPTISTSEDIAILDTYYEKGNKGTIWLNNLYPARGIELESSGTFDRDDAYGDMDASFTSTYFFTDEGYLIGEIYREHDEGYYGTGYNRDYGEFDIVSKIWVTSSSYQRPLSYGGYFWAYIFPLLAYLFVVYTIPAYMHSKPKTFVTGRKQYKISWEVPTNQPMNVVSKYAPFFKTYILRAYGQKDKVLSVSSDKGIVGLGMVDHIDNVGTFFGTYVRQMVEYSRVNYFFTEQTKFSGYQTIEKYDIFKITEIGAKTFDYDAHLIKPITDPYIPGVMRLIAEEDFGSAHPKNAKWVKEAANTDIALMAVAHKDDPWVKGITNTIAARKFPPPDQIENDIILGVGFVSPGENGGWMYGLYVHPAFRNSGVGRTLVMARLAALKELGVDTAVLEIADWNSPAKKLYAKLGADKLGRITLFGKKLPKVKIRRH